MNSESKTTGAMQSAGHHSEEEDTANQADLPYITSLLGELNQMADRAGHSMLSYFIELARLEAMELEQKALDRGQSPAKHPDETYPPESDKT